MLVTPEVDQALRLVVRVALQSPDPQGFTV
jgi:hypothetical protein